VLDWQTWFSLAIAVLIALGSLLIVVAILAVTSRLIDRRHPEFHEALRPTRRRLGLLLAVVAIRLAVDSSLPEGALRATISQVLLVIGIAAAGWLLSALLNLAMVRIMHHYPIDIADNRVARRVRTQVLILRRLGQVVIAILTLGAILLTFPGVQALGASVLASAGVLSVVAGIAAQSTLANVFAGMQLAFSDALRVDDVVIAEGEWGRIEEITLTYVVVTIWDERRLVLPSTYFTTTPFQNWTRSGSELLGAVEFDLDWRVDPTELRAELDRVLARTKLWDRRVSNVQVTDATGGLIRVRVLVSSTDAPNLWDLRCFVREELVRWIQTQLTASIPRTRVLMVDDESVDARGSIDDRRDRTEDGLFTGSPEADRRGQEMTGAITLPPADDDDASIPRG
jgi:small-conductance mechanosensitive channel